jgi:hypothetical protein
MAWYCTPPASTPIGTRKMASAPSAMLERISGLRQRWLQRALEDQGKLALFQPRGDERGRLAQRQRRAGRGGQPKSGVQVSGEGRQRGQVG